MNLAFIPLLALYGLRVCPVLSIPGFGFGCYYAATFVVAVNICNAIIVLLANSKRATSYFNNINQLWIYAFSYVVATSIALLVLQIMLHINHLGGQSRAPEILTFASLLLGVTQAYGLNWAFGAIAMKNYENVAPISVQLRWISHVARTMFPVAIAIAMLFHFLISQSQTFNQGRTAAPVPQDILIEQASYVILFLFTWLLITFFFHFLSERDQVRKVQRHFMNLEDLDFKFRSEQGGAWGLWTAILEQLNMFSKVLGERTRLLKTFSRFVTAGVAESALHQELTETAGATKELTVLMSDIRNFTGISDRLSPSQVVTLLNEYFSAMLDEISRFQINVDKFIGDGILAYVESETVDDLVETDNRLAVDAALAMINRVQVLNIKLKEMGLPEIKIGIGIFRGPLVIGLIGSEAKLQHTIIGDTVNRTARLEGLCKELGVSIVISGQIWHTLEKSTQSIFHSFGKQTVKGIAEPIDVYGGPITL